MLRQALAFLLSSLVALPPASAQQFMLDLNTPAAGVSEWSKGELLPDGEIAARVTVVELRADPKWQPGFEFLLSSGKGYAALRVNFARGAQGARPSLTVYTNGQVVSDTPIAVDIQKGKPSDMVLRWRADRTVEAYVDGALSKPVQVPFAPDRLRIRVTTADVKFEDVRTK